MPYRIQDFFKTQTKILQGVIWSIEAPPEKKPMALSDTLLGELEKIIDLINNILMHIDLYNKENETNGWYLINLSKTNLEPGSIPHVLSEQTLRHEKKQEKAELKIRELLNKQLDALKFLCFLSPSAQKNAAIKGFISYLEPCAFTNKEDRNLLMSAQYALHYHMQLSAIFLFYYSQEYPILDPADDREKMRLLAALNGLHKKAVNNTRNLTTEDITEYYYNYNQLIEGAAPLKNLCLFPLPAYEQALSIFKTSLPDTPLASLPVNMFFIDKQMPTQAVRPEFLAPVATGENVSATEAIGEVSVAQITLTQTEVQVQQVLSEEALSDIFSHPSFQTGFPAQRDDRHLLSLPDQMSAPSQDADIFYEPISAQIDIISDQSFLDELVSHSPLPLVDLSLSWLESYQEDGMLSPSFLDEELVFFEADAAQDMGLCNDNPGQLQGHGFFPASRKTKWTDEVLKKKKISRERYIKEYEALTALGYSEEQANRVIVRPYSEVTVQQLLASHTTLLGLSLEHAECVSIASHKGGSRNILALISHWDALTAAPYELSKEDIVRLASHEGGSNNILRVISHWDTLTAAPYELSKEDIVRLASHIGGSKNILRVISHWNELTAAPYELSKEDIVRLASHKGSSNNILRVISHWDTLTAAPYELSKEDIVCLASHIGGSKNILEVISHWNELTAAPYELSKMDIVRLASRDGGSNNLSAVRKYYQGLQAAGFTKEDVVRMASHGGGSRNLKHALTHHQALQASGYRKEDVVRMASQNGGSKTLSHVVAHDEELQAAGLGQDDVVRMVSRNGGSRQLQGYGFLPASRKTKRADASALSESAGAMDDRHLVSLPDQMSAPSQEADIFYETILAQIENISDQSFLDAPVSHSPLPPVDLSLSWLESYQEDGMLYPSFLDEALVFLGGDAAQDVSLCNDNPGQLQGHGFFPASRKTKRADASEFDESAGADDRDDIDDTFVNKRAMDA